MANNITPSIPEKVVQLRDKILQEFFYLQMTNIHGNSWTHHIKTKVRDRYNRNDSHKSNYHKLWDSTKNDCVEQIKIVDFDTSLISTLMNFDFSNDFQIGSNLRAKIESIRIDRNARQHNADHDNIAKTRVLTAQALINLREFLNYLKDNWVHPNAEDFANKFLKAVDALEAGLYNEETAALNYKELAFNELHTLANSNVAQAQNEMAIRLLNAEADEIEYDNETIANLFRSAAESGDPEAKARLAEIILKKSSSTKEETKQAFMMLAQAERAGCPYAQFVYGLIAFDGLGGETPNKAEAYKAFEKGAALGCVEAAMYQVYCEATDVNPEKISIAHLTRIENMAYEADTGYAYNFAGWCYGKNGQYSDAIELYKKADKKGYLVAANNLGNYYCYGKGTETDLIKAFTYYKKAADKGHTKAAFNLAWCYGNEIGTTKDLGLAFEYYKRAADKGHTSAECNLAWCYENALGTAKDLSLAFEYYKRAADKGHTDAEFNLAKCYEKQIGTDKDLNLAFEYYKKAADKGFTEAECKLGFFYHKGLGTDLDYLTAFEYFEKAASKGHTIAEYNLAICYKNGRGTTQNPELAFEYFEKTANKELAEAEYNLAICYDFGRGTDIDIQKAATLYENVALSSSSSEMAAEAKHNLINMLVREGCFDQIEKICLNNKWYNELTEKYTSYSSTNSDVTNRVSLWLMKVDAAK